MVHSLIHTVCSGQNAFGYSLLGRLIVAGLVDRGSFELFSLDFLNSQRWRVTLSSAHYSITAHQHRGLDECSAQICSSFRKVPRPMRKFQNRSTRNAPKKSTSRVAIRMFWNSPSNFTSDSCSVRPGVMPVTTPISTQTVTRMLHMNGLLSWIRSMNGCPCFEERETVE